jgi:hypothetical protein
MTDTLIPDGRLVVFNFPAGAGGKMLQNCVGLSRHCVLNESTALAWQLDYGQPIDRAYYQKKLEYVLATVPESINMANWLAYEIDRNMPYGFNFMGFRQGIPVSNINYHRAAKQGLWATTTVHNYGGAEYYPAYWPTIKHVNLSNSEQFARYCLPLKNSSLEYDQDWNTLGRTPPNLAFNFDVDNTIWNTELFVDQVQDLYKYLEFSDFPEQEISEYHQKYIAIHQ